MASVKRSRAYPAGNRLIILTTVVLVSSTGNSKAAWRGEMEEARQKKKIKARRKEVYEAHLLPMNSNCTFLFKCDEEADAMIQDLRWQVTQLCVDTAS